MSVYTCMHVYMYICVGVCVSKWVDVCMRLHIHLKHRTAIVSESVTVRSCCCSCNMKSRFDTFDNASGDDGCCCYWCC